MMCFCFFSLFRAAFVNPLTPEGPEEERLLQEGEGERRWNNRSFYDELSLCALIFTLALLQLTNRAAWSWALRRCWRSLPHKTRGRSFTAFSSTPWTPSTTETSQDIMRMLYLLHILRCTLLNLCGCFCFCSTVSFRSRILPSNSVWMEDAKLKGLEICHPQVRITLRFILGCEYMQGVIEKPVYVMYFWSLPFWRSSSRATLTWIQPFKSSLRFNWSLWSCLYQRQSESTRCAALS